MRKGQVSLELAVALAATFVLLFGVLIIFGWLNTRMVVRQERYEGHPTEGRVEAGQVSGEVIPDEGSLAPLDIFGPGP